MSLKIIDIAVDAFESLKNPIAAVNHMIVHRDGHKKWVGNHTSQHTGVHGQIVLMVWSNTFLCQALAVLQIQLAQGHDSLLFTLTATSWYPISGLNHKEMGFQVSDGRLQIFAISNVKPPLSNILWDL
jgi:hypothetical protein